MKYSTIILALMFAANAAAQSPTSPVSPQSPPVSVKRSPPPQPPTNPADAALRKRVTDDLNALQQPQKVSATAAKQPVRDGRAPTDFVVKPDMPLLPTA